jgi:hypothetical protein
LGRHRNRKRKKNQKLWEVGDHTKNAASSTTSTFVFCDTCAAKFEPAAKISIIVNENSELDTNRDNSDLDNAEKFIEGFTLELGKYTVDMCIKCIAENKHKELPKEEPGAVSIVHQRPSTPLLLPAPRKIIDLPFLQYDQQRQTLVNYPPYMRHHENEYDNYD